MAHYIIQVVLFQLLFLLMYDFLLKKETFFIYNRLYLLTTPVIALVLPLLKFETLGNMVAAESIIMLPEVYLGGAATDYSGVKKTASTPEGFQMNLWWLIYGAGVSFRLFLFVKRYRVLKSLSRNKIITEEKDIRIIEVPDSNLACTFFNTIFLGDKLKKEEIKQILSHEMVHVRQKHSADLVFFEIFKILFWFNPLIYIYQSRISTLHEFIADAGVVKTVAKKIYYQQLLNTAFNTENISFINQFFNHSLIKKRIVMLQKSRSNTIAKFKYLILVPLMLAMLTYVSCSQDPDNNTFNTENSTVDDSEILIVNVERFGSRTSEEEARIKEALNNFSNSDYQTIRITDGTSGLEMIKDAEEGAPSIRMIGKTTKKKTSATASEYSGGDVPFAVIEEVPVFPGCEGLSSNKDRKECMSQKVTDFVNANFDVAAAKPYAKPGVNRIYVQFKIKKNGSVEELGIRAPSPELEEEARKVVNQLPNMTPGKQKGQEVAVLYTLPIVFNAGK